MAKRKVGEVFHYYPKPRVAAIRLMEGGIRVGDEISLEGATTNFTQVVESMEIDQESVESAEAGDEVGIQVRDRVRPGDAVYRHG